jgi:hypothetical protein
MKNLWEIYRKICGRSYLISDNESMRLAEIMKEVAGELMDDPGSVELLKEFRALETEWMSLNWDRRTTRYGSQLAYAIESGDYYVKPSFKSHDPVTGVLYCAHLPSLGKEAIKIGIAADPERRLQRFVRRYKYEMLIIFYRVEVVAPKVFETIIHTHLGGCRLHGEPSKEIFGISRSKAISAVRGALSSANVRAKGDRTEVYIA